MDIIEDSMKILTFVYKKNKTNQLEIEKESGFDKDRVKRAMEFLEQEKLIEYAYKSLEGIRKGIKCTSKSITLIESPKESEDRKSVALTLNVNVDSLLRIDFESLLKVDSIFRGSLL